MRCLPGVFAVGLLLAGIAFAGCLEMGGDAEISYEVLEEGTQTGFKDNETRLRVVTNESDWARFWETHTEISHPPPERPEVNITERFVAALFLGQRPSGGYGLNVTDVVVAEGEYRIHYEEIAPGRGCGVPAVITHPHVILTLERRADVGTDVGLVFEGERVFECG